ncbi:hypothetical protein O3P69_000565 [Scylla paramamosain]|uniref:acylphosphatase n=1 Tax=Scylla paramamosain TaxID=85552 RepID=A0AAW0UV74_SCYPA
MIRHYTSNPAVSVRSASITELAMASQRLLAVDFEVFGRVQGVFFRKYTKKKAVELGIRGWCKNTEEKTVTGQLEGPCQQLSHMYASSLQFGATVACSLFIILEKCNFFL